MNNKKVRGLDCICDETTVREAHWGCENLARHKRRCASTSAEVRTTLSQTWDYGTDRTRMRSCSFTARNLTIVVIFPLEHLILNLVRGHVGNSVRDTDRPIMQPLERENVSSGANVL